MVREALDDGVGGVHHPEDLLFAHLPPAEELAVDATQLAEDFAGVAGVQDNEASAGHNLLIDLFHDLNRHLGVGHAPHQRPSVLSSPPG